MSKTVTKRGMHEIWDVLKVSSEMPKDPEQWCKRVVSVVRDLQKRLDEAHGVRNERIGGYDVSTIDVTTPKNNNMRCAMVLGVRAHRLLFRIRDAFDLDLAEEAVRPELQQTDIDLHDPDGEKQRSNIAWQMKRSIAFLISCTDTAQAWMLHPESDAGRANFGDERPVQAGDYIGLMRVFVDAVHIFVSGFGWKPFQMGYAHARLVEAIGNLVRDVDHEQAEFERAGYTETIASRADEESPHDEVEEREEDDDPIEGVVPRPDWSQEVKKPRKQKPKKK